MGAKDGEMLVWGGKRLLQSGTHRLGFKLLGSLVAFLCLLTWPMMKLIHDVASGSLRYRNLRGK
jgi:hypothetical protein